MILGVPYIYLGYPYTKGYRKEPSVSGGDLALTWRSRCELGHAIPRVYEPAYSLSEPHDMKIGFPFQTHPGSQASPRGEAEDSTFLSSRDTDLLEPNALGGTRRVGGLLGVAGRLSGTVSPFSTQLDEGPETP